ncbi:MAG: MFS transporter [Candidatus Lokiarchaeota archaeon]|nr:MFS transporter [Candidatus Lokiarchaeota archaeon]MBD3198388.1 MFS transporter [Candidatus Lokiarchaeota archaeon]
MEIQPTKQSFRNYLIFWSGQLFSLLGSSVIQFVMIWWIERQYSNVIYLSLANFFFILPLVVFMPLGGVLCDRYNKRKLIFTVDALQAFVTFVLIILFTLNMRDLWIVFLFIALRSSLQGIHQPTVSSIAPSMVPKEKLSRINGLSFLFNGFIQLIGPAIGALLYVLIPFNQIFWIDILTFLISVIPLALIQIPKVRELEETDVLNVKSFIGDIKEGFDILKSIPGLLILLGTSIVINFLLQPVNVLLPYYIHQIHGGLEFEYSMGSILLQAGTIIGALVTSLKKKWNRKILTMISGIVIIGIGYTILAIIPPGAFLFIWINFFILGLVLPLINTIYQTILQISVPQDKIGRVSSIDMMFSMMISPIGSLISGPIASVISVNSLFFVSGSILTGLMIFTYMFTNIRHVRYEEEVSDEEVAKVEEKELIPITED